MIIGVLTCDWQPDSSQTDNTSPDSARFITAEDCLIEIDPNKLIRL
jgi:hypothetical protein